MTKQSEVKTTKGLLFSRKHTAGKVVGIQNLLPQFQDQGETVFFTDNNMVVQLYEIDVAALRAVFMGDRDLLLKLW